MRKLLVSLESVLLRETFGGLLKVRAILSALWNNVPAYMYRPVIKELIAPFNNTRILKFKAQMLKFMFYVAVNYSGARGPKARRNTILLEPMPVISRGHG